MKEFFKTKIFLLLLLGIPSLALKFDQNRGDFELRLAVTKWFIENDNKLVKMNQNHLRDKFIEMIETEGLNGGKSEKELEKAFDLVKNLQKKKKELGIKKEELIIKKEANTFKFLKNNKESGSTRSKWSQWSG